MDFGKLPSDVRGLADTLVELMKALPNNKARKAVIDRIGDDFCHHCGRVIGDRPCYCTKY